MLVVGQLNDVHRWLTNKRLDEDDLEDIVDPGTGRQGQTIGQGVNPVQHPERPVEAWHLPSRFVGDGCSEALMETKPHPVAHCELHETMLGVVLHLDELLRVKEMERLPVLQLVIQRLNPSSARLVGNQTISAGGSRL